MSGTRATWAGRLPPPLPARGPGRKQRPATNPPRPRCHRPSRSPRPGCPRNRTGALPQPLPLPLRTGHSRWHPDNLSRGRQPQYRRPLVLHHQARPPQRRLSRSRQRPNLSAFGPRSTPWRRLRPLPLPSRPLRPGQPLPVRLSPRPPGQARLLRSQRPGPAAEKPGKAFTSGCPTVLKPRLAAPRHLPGRLRLPPAMSRTSPALTMRPSRSPVCSGARRWSVFWAES